MLRRNSSDNKFIWFGTSRPLPRNTRRGPLRHGPVAVALWDLRTYGARRVSRRPHGNSIIHTSHLNSGSINKRRHLTRPGVRIVTARAREHAIRNEIFYIIILYSINTGKLKSLRESAHKPVPRDFRRRPTLVKHSYKIMCARDVYMDAARILYRYGRTGRNEIVPVWKGEETESREKDDADDIIVHTRVRIRDGARTG